MTLKRYLKSLESQSKKLFSQGGIFDIVLYGSSVKSKDEPRDIDIAIIFLDKKMKERLEVAWQFKKNLPSGLDYDIQTLNISEFFDEGFLARKNILIEGFSLVSKKKISEKLGFSGQTLFSYSLGNLDHNEKTKFIYSLSGRGKIEGMIKKTHGKIIGKGAFLIPVENSLLFEEFLEKWRIKFSKKNILVQHDN